MSPFSVIGRSLPRVDGPQKVSGLTRYVADLQLPGMLHARLVLSPFAHARIRRIDASRAVALPGVVGVFTARDLPLARQDSTSRERAPLAIDRVLFNGHPVAAVVAEDPAVAEDAIPLVEVDYEELPAALDPLEAMRPDAPPVREQRLAASAADLAAHGADVGAQQQEESAALNVGTTLHFTRGDVARGFREAEVVVERTYRTSWVHQGYLEPRAAVASCDPLGGVVVYTSTQALFSTRTAVARALGLPDQQVRVIAMPVGGAFGAKFVLLEPLVAALARATRRPVSLVLSRGEDFLATTPAPQSQIELKLGARRDGRLIALQARVVFDTGAFPDSPVGIACSLLGGYYRVPNLDLRGYEVLTHRAGAGAYRAPGAPQATFAIESAMDELARRLGIHPLGLRLLNASRPGDPQPDGKPWPKMGLLECLEALKARLAAWPARASGERGPVADVGSPLIPGPRSLASRPAPLRGVGLAVGGWGGGRQPATAVCRLNSDGSLTVVVGSIDLSGTNTALAMIAAEAFGLPAERVQVVNGDTESAPYAGVTGGSKITYTVGAAVKLAAEDARRQALAIAADLLESSPEDVELADGRVQVRGAPERAVSLRRVYGASTDFGGQYPPVFGRGASAIVVQAPGFAAHLAEVEVDPDTGQVRVTRWLAVQDVGRAINPAAIEGQVRGAVAQGIGWALLERMAYDQDGRLLSASFMDYALPGADQTPPVEVVLLEVPAEHGPYGAKQVGEPPVVAAAAAIANAVADATGRRFTQLPITAEAIAGALQTRRD